MGWQRINAQNPEKETVIRLLKAFIFLDQQCMPGLIDEFHYHLFPQIFLIF